ncbi:MAG: hypothetical protein A2X84_04315 [Desulfuromonadaceae bacterium GWC2_58_13]|nr:MAG: hypothetical protein A2X84_04315 [Desulfuromonadaceae bacterium GWC2_58_13]
MKTAILPYLVRIFILPAFVTCLVLAPRQTPAQDSDYLAPSEKYSREELTQMLAPIALYPDALLSQVLMASTYPIEVIEADRWVRMNSDLRDESLDAAILDMDWDPSVKAICHFPSILALMSERIGETTNIGNAFLAQEDEVMDMVQELRTRAYAQSNLTTNSEQKVIVERETIIIEPADPRVIYVPYYDPYYVYGTWWYPAYPPYYWGPPGVRLGLGISYWPGFYFGFSFGTWSYFDWHQHSIHIDVHNRPRFVRHDRWVENPGRWQHAPKHRRGVAYREKFTARKYGQSPPRAIDDRRDTRGFPEHQDLDRPRRGDDRIIVDRDRQEREQRERIDPARQERKRVEPAKQERARIEPAKQERKRVEPAKQERKRVEPVKQERARVEPVMRAPQQKNRENVFNRVEDGSRERISSERGQVSRQGWKDDSAVGGGSSKNDRDEPGRNRH